MRSNGRLKLAALLAVTLTLSVAAAVATADDVTNDLDATVDAVAENMPLQQDGATGATTLAIVARNSDGKSGCNLTGSTTLVVSVQSSDASVATVGPSQVTFTSCGDTQGLTVTPHAPGTATISLSQVSNTTSGSFNLAPATFTVTVSPPPNTPPQISVNGVTDGASYDKGSVPGATCQVSDAEDGNSSFAATLSAVSGPNAADGIGQQTASCSYTDAGGLTASASKTYSIIDPSAPTIDGTLTPASPDGQNGWYVSDVTLTWDVEDLQSPLSLLKSGCVNQSITSDQAATSYSCSASSAGGSAGPDTVTIKRDATKPVISRHATDDGCDVAGNNGWCRGTQTAGFTASDVTSGLVDGSGDPLASPHGFTQSTADNGSAVQISSGGIDDAAGNEADAIDAGPFKIDSVAPSTPTATTNPSSPAYGDWFKDSVTVSYGGSNDDTSGVAGYTLDQTFDTSGEHTYSGTATDNAGNVSDAAAGSVKVDSDNPQVTLTCPSGNLTEGSVASATWGATDAESGVAGAASGSVLLDTSSIGAKTAAVPAGTAVDNVGHQSDRATCSYNVVYNWNGFYSPVNNLPVWNAAKAGSAVPVKFSLDGPPLPGSNTSGQGAEATVMQAGYPVSQRVDCNSSAALDTIEQTVTAGMSTLTYDPLADQWVYVWKTDKSYAGTCRQLVVGLADGTLHVANFSFSK